MSKRACSACGETFPATVEFFRRSKECVGGIAHKCLSCQRAYVRDYKRAHAADISAQRRAAYAADGGARSKAREHRRRRRDPWAVRAQRMRAGMLERSRGCGVPFDAAYFSTALLKVWLGNNRNCSCCHVEMVVAPAASATERDRTPSVDRIVPVIGYIRGNVAIICWRCNNLKRDATADELQLVVNWMRRIRRPDQAEAA